MTTAAKRISLHPKAGVIVPPSMRGLASALLSCETIGDLRTLAPLPKDAQELIDRATVQVGLDRLVIVGDFINAGLTFNLPDPLSVMELYWEKEAKVGHAQRTMLPGARNENQLAERTGTSIPIYCTTDDFSLNIRTLRASERAGAPLDTSTVSQTTRRVNEAVEDACIKGWTDDGGSTLVSVNGNTAPGLLNAPNVNTFTYVDNEAWTAAAHSGEDILTDVLSAIDQLQADRMYGPYNVYVPTTYDNKLNQDFKANSDKTIRQRLEEISVVRSVKAADQLPSNRVVVVQMTSDVMDIVVGQMPIPVSWEDGPGWNRNFVILAFLIPRVKDTYSGQSGICVGNTT